MLALLAMMPFGSVSVAATKSAGASQSAKSAQTAQASRVDPASVAALNTMGEYLRTLTSFDVNSDTTMDSVLNDNQKVQLDGTVDYKVRRPNAFMIDLQSDRKNRQFYYDGKNFTMYAPRMNLYTTLAAPPTIGEVFRLIYDKYGIEVPLEDLFRWGLPDDKHDLTTGAVVGPAKLGGVDSTQYAFREGDRDWQIWIQNGDKPLPLKIVIVKTSDIAMPEFSSTLHWNTAATFPDSTFTFSPPKDAKPITIVSASR